MIEQRTAGDGEPSFRKVLALLDVLLFASQRPCPRQARVYLFLFGCYPSSRCVTVRFVESGEGKVSGTEHLSGAGPVLYLLDSILQISWVALPLLLPPLQMRKPRLQVNKCPVHTCPVPQSPLSICLYLAECAGRGALSLSPCCSPYKHREWVRKGFFLTST